MIRPLTVLLLAAGFGTRLRPYTDQWPKCLMPIKEKPALEHWLTTVKRAGATNVLVNLHYLAEIVQEFLSRSIFKDWVYGIYEPSLTGTVGHFARIMKIYGIQLFCWCMRIIIATAILMTLYDFTIPIARKTAQ